MKLVRCRELLITIVHNYYYLSIIQQHHVTNFLVENQPFFLVLVPRPIALSTHPHLYKLTHITAIHRRTVFARWSLPLLFDNNIYYIRTYTPCGRSSFVCSAGRRCVRSRRDRTCVIIFHAAGPNKYYIN